MRSLILCIPLLLGGLVPAQDLEPSLQRAAANLAGQIGRLLPALETAPEALTLVPGPGASAPVLGALASALAEDGYRVEIADAERAASGSLQIHVRAASDREPRRIELELGVKDAPTLVCLHGDADWIDRTPRGALQVEGPFRTLRDAAVDAAYALAWHRMRASHGLGLEDGEGVELVRRFPRRLMLTHARADDGTRVWRAWLQVLPDRSVLAHLKRKEQRSRSARRWEPLLRLGGILALALIVGAGYLHTDLRTRGYMTGTLRILFGILFLIGVFICWKATL